MFTESEMDENTNFVPKDTWDDNFYSFCRKYCRNYEDCPYLYKCPTMVRWDIADAREL